MAKSSVTAALKSLSYKFQQKIKEVGELKRKLGNEEHQNEVIRQLRVYSALDKEAYKRLLESRDNNLAMLQNERAAVRNLKGEVQGWQQFCVIATVLGAVVGGLGVYAYLTL